jgi:replicative DNA helicase
MSDILPYQNYHRIDLLCGFKWNLDWLREEESLMIDAQELEKAIIGCILMDHNLYLVCKDMLDLDDFRYDVCEMIYKAMIALETRGRTIDPIMVVNELRSKYEEKDFPTQWVYQLANEAPSGSIFEEYVDELIETRALERERNGSKDV